MFMTKAMRCTKEMAMAGKELKEAISNIDPKFQDVSAFKERMKGAYPSCADAIEELFSGVK